MGEQRVIVMRPDATRHDVITLNPKRAKLAQLQELVGGGNIERVPTFKSTFVAYANENGIGLDLPSNYLAYGILLNLGFNVSSALLPGAYFGPIVLAGPNGHALSDVAIALVDKAYDNYCNELDG
jgi:hypothetical protein